VLVIDDGRRRQLSQGLPRQNGHLDLPSDSAIATLGLLRAQPEACKKPEDQCCYLRIATACLITDCLRQLVLAGTNFTMRPFSVTAYGGYSIDGGRARSVAALCVQQGRHDAGS